MAQETSLDKALNVLEMIAQAGDTRLSTLAAATGYPPATIHRILGVLVRRRYVRQDLRPRRTCSA
jgi:DNA-binding IclR family transcriptional regulator